MPVRTKKPASPPTEIAIAIPVVPDEVIDEVVLGIHALHHEATVDMHIKMGALIVDKFYGGDLAVWRNYGVKEVSFKRLAARFGDGEVSAPALSRAVGLYELDQRLGVSARKRLTATHLRAVLGLPDDKQRKLLADAEEKGWETRRLETEAAKVRKKIGEGRGRPPLPRFIKTIHRLTRLVEAAGAFEDLDQAEALSEAESTELYQAVTGMKLKCEALQKALEAKTKGFTPRDS